MTEDGKPEQQDLPGAHLSADFRDAILSNAQLASATALRSEQLAGAVLTDARLPPNIEQFEAPLAHVAETSQNARKTFFALLAAALYSWLTIATTADAELITDTASSPLPIINTEIPLAGFYLVAPLILLAVYFYFHLYLQRLWRGLSTLPAIFPDGKALDEKAYPWLLNGLVRAHFRNLKLSQRPLSRLENVLSIVLAMVGDPDHPCRLLALLPSTTRLVRNRIFDPPDGSSDGIRHLLLPARRRDAGRDRRAC